MAVHRETWTDENVATLRRMHGAGEPFSRIAHTIGMSRSAAIGKAHRLGLGRPPQPPAVKAAKLPRPKAIREARTPSPPPRLPVDPIERQELFNARADKALDRFDAIVAASRTDDDPGVLFLDPGSFRCAMPMPGWDDLPVDQKRVCGKPVAFRSGGAPTSYCPACSRIAYAPAGFQSFKDRDVGAAA